jgi:hypothetical protein
MTGPELVQAVETAGGVLMLRGSRIQYQLPKSAAVLLEQLRQHRKEILRILQGKEEGLRCHLHGTGASWWTRADGSQVCAQCHPDPFEEAAKKCSRLTQGECIPVSSAIRLRGIPPNTSFIVFGVVLRRCSSTTSPDSFSTQYQLDRSPRSNPMVNVCSEIFLLGFAATVLPFFIAGLLLSVFPARR